MEFSGPKDASHAEEMEFSGPGDAPRPEAMEFYRPLVVSRSTVHTESGVEYYPDGCREGSFFGRGGFRGGRPFFDIHVGF